MVVKTDVSLGENDNVNRDIDSVSKEEEVIMQVEQEEGDGEVVTAVGRETTGGDVERGVCGESRGGGSVGQESGPASAKSAAARPTSAILGRYGIHVYYTLCRGIVCSL